MHSYHFFYLKGYPVHIFYGKSSETLCIQTKEKLDLPEYEIQYKGDFQYIKIPKDGREILIQKIQKRLPECSLIKGICYLFVFLVGFLIFRSVM